MTEVIWRVPNKQIETNSQLSALYVQTMFPFVLSVAIFYISILYFVNSFSNKSHEKTKTPTAFYYVSLLSVCWRSDLQAVQSRCFNLCFVCLLPPKTIKTKQPPTRINIPQTALPPATCKHSLADCFCLHQSSLFLSEEPQTGKSSISGSASGAPECVGEALLRGDRMERASPLRLLPAQGPFSCSSNAKWKFHPFKASEGEEMGCDEFRLQK